MFLSATCPVCRRQQGAPCAECRELFVPVGAITAPPGLDGLVTACWYLEAARPLVAGLKYRDQRAVVGFVADLMVDAAGPALGRRVVTWAPTLPARRRRRGFDHAELLARAVARRASLPCRSLLRRASGAAQTGRSAADRRTDPPRFSASARRTPTGVLLVDDVTTTGATLASAATALRAAGAVEVTGLVAAATPPPSRPD